MGKPAVSEPLFALVRPHGGFFVAKPAERDAFQAFSRLPNSMEVKTAMPNAKVLAQKQAIVEDLTQKIRNATAGVLVDYKGITVDEDTALRRECRESGVHYAVIKNTLLRFAFNNTGLNELDGLLNGTTSLALSDDPVAPARVMADYAKKLDGKFEIKGGFMDGAPVPLDTINALAAIPPLPILRAQALGTMLAPITGLAVVLKQIAEKKGAPAEEPAAAE